MFTRGIQLTPGSTGSLDQLLASAKAGESGGATGAMGLYAHNTMAQLANSGWGGAMATGAAAGGIYGGASGFINNDGIIGGAAQGALTGAMFGAAAKGAGGMYAKNAVGAGGSMVHDVGTGKYSTSIAAGANGKFENPFQWSYFTSAERA